MSFCQNLIFKLNFNQNYIFFNNTARDIYQKHEVHFHNLWTNQNYFIVILRKKIKYEIFKHLEIAKNFGIF